MKNDVSQLEVERIEALLRGAATFEPDCRESDEDAVLDVMDALLGWCHPSAELLPEKPGP